MAGIMEGARQPGLADLHTVCRHVLLSDWDERAAILTSMNDVRGRTCADHRLSDVSRFVRFGRFTPPGSVPVFTGLPRRRAWSPQVLLAFVFAFVSAVSMPQGRRSFRPSGTVPDFFLTFIPVSRAATMIPFAHAGDGDGPCPLKEVRRIRR